MKNDELSDLWTAEKANTKALHGMWHDWICGRNCYVECTVLLFPNLWDFHS